MTPDNATGPHTPVDMSEVPLPEYLRMLYAALARYTVATRLAGLSREPS